MNRKQKQFLELGFKKFLKLDSFSAEAIDP